MLRIELEVREDRRQDNVPVALSETLATGMPFLRDSRETKGDARAPNGQ